MAVKWWQETVIYQIYPRSFQDTNGDGFGDLQGILQHLDYLEKLGIGAIWLSPVYASPNDDNGYDISDYQSIMKEFGTMKDMEELIAAAKAHQIRIIMDLVVNHTSDEHKWFVEAKKEKDSPYRDYYIWRDPVDGKEPNDLRSTFSGSAWEYEEQSGQYYLHLFSKKQPDLNWENPQVQSEIWAMMNFWLEKGIGGFRLDVIDLIGKLPDQKIIGNGPRLHEYLQTMNQKTFGDHDVMTVGETWGATPEIAKLYSDPDRKELSMVFQFEHMSLDEIPGKEKWDTQPLDLIKLKKIMSKWQTSLEEKGWNSLFWNNHDLPRIVSRFGNDTAEFRKISAKMLATILHMMKGTPYIYQGEEIGLTNTAIMDISEADDIESINMYNERLQNGYSEEELLSAINKKGRDNARRPIPWNDEPNGGFTTGTPWLALNPDYKEINVAAALIDPDSVFFHYQKLIQLRKNHSIIVWGDYQELSPNDPSLFVFERFFQGEKWLIIANFYQTNAVYYDKQRKAARIILSNYSDSSLNLEELPLRSYEAVVYQLK